MSKDNEKVEYTNIEEQDYSKFEQNNKVEGFYPFGNNGFWHSGIHIEGAEIKGINKKAEDRTIDENKTFTDMASAIKPLLGGKLISYRIAGDYKKIALRDKISEREYNQLSQNIRSCYKSDTKAKFRELKNKSAKDEVVPVNFFLIEHEIGKDFLKFYSLYYNIQCDKVRLANYYNYKSDREYKEEIYKQIKPFYKTYSLKIEPNEECKVNYLKDTDIVLGSIVKSAKEMTAEEFNEKIQTPDTFILENCKTNVTNGSTVSSQPFDPTKACSNICVKFINISSISIKEIPLYRKDENKIYGEAGYYKPEKVGIYKKEYFATECNKRVDIDCDNSAIDIDSEFSDPTYMIPMDFVELNVNKKLNEKDVHVYQKRYQLNGFSGRDVYRVDFSAKEKIDEVNRPLYYVDITSSISRNIKDIIFIISEKEIATLLHKEKIKLKFEYDKYGLIKNFQEEDITDENNVDIDAEYSNEKYCICYYSNISSEQKDELKIFWDGNEITPLNIENNDFFNLFAADKKLNTELAKSFNNDSLIVFEVKPTVVNELDSFMEFSAAQYGDKLKKIKERSKYYLCNRCIQPQLQIKYELDLPSAKITSIKGSVKTDIEASNIKTETNQLCFRSSPEEYSTPLYVIENKQEFYYEPIPERTEVSLPANDNDEEKYIYHIKNFLFKGSVCSCDVPEDCVSVKLVNNPEIAMENIDNDQIVTLQNGIPVTPSNILGQAFYDFKYDNFQSYYDVCMFMNSNLPNNKDYKKKYLFYKKLKGGEVVYEDTKKLHSFYLPKNTEVELSELEVYNNTSQYVGIKIKRIPVFVEEQKYLEADFKGQKEIIKKPDSFFLNNHKVNATNNTSNVDKYMAELFYRNIGKILQKKLSIVDYRDDKIGIWINSKDIGLVDEFYCFAPYLPNVKSCGVYTIRESDCQNLRCYKNDPIKSEVNSSFDLYLPVETLFSCTCIITYSNVKIYKIKIISIPVYIKKEYFKKTYELKENNPKIWLSKKQLEEFSTNTDYEKFYKSFNGFKNSKGCVFEEYISSKDNGNAYAGIYLDAEILDLTKLFYIDRQTALTNFTPKDSNNKDVINAKLRISPAISKCKISSDFKLYDKNPDYLDCKEKMLTANDEIKRIDSKNAVSRTNRGALYKISLKDDSKEYFIKTSDLQKFSDDATDWEKYFVDIGEDDDIESINLSKIKDKLELSNDEVNRFNKYEAIEDAYSSDEFDSNKEMLQKFRKIIVKHPHEWDCDGYKDLKEKDPKIKYAKDFTKVAEIVSKLQCFNGSEKQKTYFHPIYFYNHLKSSGMLEFNPYENDSLSDLKNLVKSTVIDKRTGKNYDLSKNKLDNPGFAPYTGIGSEYSNIQGYAKVNGYFMQDYGNYGHEGVDFTGNGWIARSKPKEEHTPIHSLINGVVVKMADHGKYNYGLHMIISDGNNKLYLLGHLCGYANGITVGSNVTPKTVVGYVGNTGNCKGYDESVKEDGRGSHLHLSIFKFEDSFAKDIISMKESNIEKEVNSRIRIKDTRYADVYTYSCYDNAEKSYKVIDPFNHVETRK